MSNSNKLRMGAIDIGTNSCRMLLADYERGSITEIKRDSRITRLGEGVDSNRKLTDNAVRRALGAVEGFVSEMHLSGVREISINGTSALRDVNNADKLIDAIKEETGCTLTIISGAEEARLNYLGIGDSSSNSLIIDIGGGSTEFIWKNRDRIQFKSIDMGAVRMTERHLQPKSIIDPGDLKAMERDIRSLLENESSFDGFKADKVVGLGGTITTLAAIDQKMTEYDSKKVEGYRLGIETICNILDTLSKLPLEERKEVKGLQPGRADIIVAGIQILNIILTYLEISEIYVSEHDLLYGAIKEMGANVAN